jgi:hypothetical protein
VLANTAIGVAPTLPGPFSRAMKDFIAVCVSKDGTQRSITLVLVHKESAKANQAQRRSIEQPPLAEGRTKEGVRSGQSLG